MICHHSIRQPAQARFQVIRSGRPTSHRHGFMRDVYIAQHRQQCDPQGDFARSMNDGGQLGYQYLQDGRTALSNRVTETREVMQGSAGR